MTLVRQQADSRVALAAERQRSAGRLADLKVQQANVEAQRARMTAEVGRRPTSPS
jgi:hypothetical protein